MSKPIHQCNNCFAAFIVLSLLSGVATAQSADQAIKSIPQTTKQTAETKVVTKSNSVSNGAMNILDSSSDKAFRGFIGLFKKKNHVKDTTAKRNLTGDSTRLNRTDSLVTPIKSTSRISVMPPRYCLMRRLQYGHPFTDLS